MDFTRRDFNATALAGSVALAAPTWAQDGGKPDDINIAIIGPGSQGRNLLINTLKIPGVRFKAVCDIWSYHQKYAANILKKFKHDVNVYSDYREMLAKEAKNLDAVIIATPDWMHSEHTVACLKAGLHVYCEKEMSNTLEGAAAMVRASKESGKLLQIGHQRRSNIRYHHSVKLKNKDKVLGQITHCFGQWNRRHRLELGWPEKYTIDAATLKEYGYDSMDAFRNWRWYKQYSGGPMADLGSHQIDVFSWFLNANPVSVYASGGVDYYKEKGRDWYDNVMAIYEYDAVQPDVGTTRVRAFYQVLNTTSHGGFFETFMGDAGTLVISEDARKGFFFREPTENTRREWEDQSETVKAMGTDAITLKIGQTLAPDGSKDPAGQRLLEESKKPVHQLHLENFFNALRDPKKNKLSCPGEIGYETAVAVLKANESVEGRKVIDFKPDDFHV